MTKKNNIEKKRGRGRPKINKSARIVSIKSDDDMSSDENLILKLNVSDSDSEKDNKKHTMISLSSKYYSESDSSENSESCDSSEKSSSDSDLSDDSSSDDDSSAKISKENKELKKIIREKEEMINNLKKKLNEIKFNENTNTGMKEIAIVKPIDMKLIDLRSGKSVVVEKTDNPCWWCFHKFKDFPWFLPDYSNNCKYHVFGCFCSVNCASAYNDDLNDSRVDTRRVLLKKYCREITKTLTDVDIISAPARELLLSGALTIEEFRDKNISTKKEYRTKIPPIMPLVLNLEIHNRK